MAVLDCTLEELIFAEKPKTKRFVDIEGQRCGRLKVIGYAGSNNQKTSWYCLCDCGNIVQAKTRELRNQDTKSCGCLGPDRHKEVFTKHGKCGSREYRIYRLILDRCNNPSNINFHNYGGRGIKCKFASFEEFYSEVGDSPSPKHSIDRVNNEKGYEAGNLRWATQKEQNRNTRVVKHLTVDGRTKTRPDWAEELGCPPRLLYDRKKLGWCDACAAKTLPGNQPSPCNQRGCKSNESTRHITVDGETLSVTQWAKKVNLTPNTIFGRLFKGWCPTHAIYIPQEKGKGNRPKNCEACKS